MPVDNFSREVIGGIVVERVNLTRATVKEAQEFKDRLLHDSVTGFNRIIVDFSKCNFIDSSMIGALVIALKRISEKGGELRVVIPDEKAFQIFTITGLFRAFNLYKSVDEALKGFD